MNGEWQEGDIALENAEVYVDPNGDIIQETTQCDDDRSDSPRDKHHSLDYLENVMAISLQQHV